MTEQEAIFMAQSIFQSQDLYILLSTKQADMVKGISVPYMGEAENGEKFLFLFTSYENAKIYVEESQCEILDGVYPIGKIQQEDQYRNLFQICNIAVNKGIENLNVDLGTENAFGCKIRWLLQVNDKVLEPVSILLSKEEAEHMMEQNENQVPLRMNPMVIMNFTNPYEIEKEQANRLFHHVFEGGTTVGDFMDNFRNQETLLENCFLCDYINTKFIPSAQQQNKPEDIGYFQQVSSILEKVIWQRIFEHKIYTIVDKSTGNPMINNQSMYLIYTNRFQYTGGFLYQEMADKEAVMKFIKENEISRVVVTDGPNFMAVLGEDTIFQ